MPPESPLPGWTSGEVWSDSTARDLMTPPRYGRRTRVGRPGPRRSAGSPRRSVPGIRAGVGEGALGGELAAAVAPGELAVEQVDGAVEQPTTARDAALEGVEATGHLDQLGVGGRRHHGDAHAALGDGVELGGQLGIDLGGLQGVRQAPTTGTGVLAQDAREVVDQGGEVARLAGGPALELAPDHVEGGLDHAAKVGEA